MRILSCDLYWIFQHFHGRPIVLHSWRKYVYSFAQVDFDKLKDSLLICGKEDGCILCLFNVAEFNKLWMRMISSYFIIKPYVYEMLQQMAVVMDTRIY